MRLTTTEDALRRVLDYLVNSGVELTTDVISTAVEMVNEGLRRQPDNLLPWVMHQLPYRFGLEHPQPSRIQPPLQRASIGYQ
jgi:hypothetical protein